MRHKMGQVRKYRVVLPVAVIVEVPCDKGLYAQALQKARERVEAEGHQVSTSVRPTVTPVDLDAPETD